ncbi:type B 50S ribosomal protein L31 [Candidatus Saccharibacteria bacterium]|nr:type B 50S ribosomal protein L31 [Candidatus Saccharibacteria bacterium]
MKKSIQPKEYDFVVFADEQAKFSFLTRSTAKSEETIKWTDGKEYPLVKVQISSASHPFFTGEEKIIDTEGRVDRFKARAKKAEALKATRGNKVAKAQKEAAKKAAKADK